MSGKSEMVGEKTNEELARTALDALEILQDRGNRAIAQARSDVAFFYADIVSLTARARALEKDMGNHPDAYHSGGR